MPGPYFLIDGGDVAAFHDERALCRGVEYWMKDRPVEIFDATGARVELVVGEAVEGVIPMEEQPRPAHLRRVLETYVLAVGLAVPRDLADEAFARAVADAVAIDERWQAAVFRRRGRRGR